MGYVEYYLYSYYNYYIHSAHEPPSCFHGPTRVAAQEMWCTTVLLRYMLLFLQYYYDNVRPSHEAPHRLSRAETRTGPCTTCTKKQKSGILL